MSEHESIRCVIMHGGTSKGLYFREPRQCHFCRGQHECYASSGGGSSAAVAGHDLDCGCGSQQEKR
jgi:hypothetical protein